jgi:uncharacterized protein (TIGR01777 family)
MPASSVFEPNTRNIFVKTTKIPATNKVVFEYHAREGALERLVPPWSILTITNHEGSVRDGATSTFKVNLGFIRFKWTAVHFGYSQDRKFEDKMVRGPFQTWIHTHSFIPSEIGHCMMEDKIVYSPLSGKLGSMLLNNTIQRNLSQLFHYRHRILRNDINLSKIAEGSKGKKILMTGSHGLIGSSLIPLLTAAGEHKITRLTRDSSSLNTTNMDSIAWDISDGKVDTKDLEGFDVVIHLAGENIFGRWTTSKKERIMNSRMKSTRLLCDSLTNLVNPPSTLICASATGYYGNRGDEALSEESKPGIGFLSDVCQKWEESTESARNAGIRVVNMRFGVVLTPKGGMLQKLLAPSRFRVGLRFGDENQYISWVSIEDVIGSIFYSIINPSIRGPVNVVSPNPVTNQEFFKTLAQIVNSKILLPVPHKITKAMLGDLADTLITSSALVIPKKLSSAGYRFINADLEDTLRLLLGRQQIIT